MKCQFFLSMVKNVKPSTHVTNYPSGFIRSGDEIASYVRYVRLASDVHHHLAVLQFHNSWKIYSC